VHAAQVYISALFTVFIIVIFVRILLSFAPRPPGSRAGRAVWDFFHQSTDWFLNFFRRFIPPLGMFDLSPIVAVIVLYILRSLILSLMDSL
jgi:YggT family protein